MENFLAGRSSVAKLSTAPKITANLFTSLANRTAPRSGSEKPAGALTQPVAGHAQHSHEAQVEPVRDEEGVIRRIVVVCTCGERIELDCKY